MLEQSTARSTFRASTGAPAYDAIDFSAEPVATLLSRRDGPVALVHHIGINAEETAFAASHNPSAHVLLMNLSSSGRMRARCGDVRAERPLQRGHISFLPGCHPTELEIPTCQSVLAMTVSAPHLDRIIRDLGVIQAAPLLSERHDRLAQLIGMIEAELRTPGFASDLMVDGLVRAMATILVRQDGCHAEHEVPRIHLSPARLARVLEFVESRLEGEISLSDMARIAGLSSFHFSRVFKLSTGETPYHFLGSRRLSRARALLINSEMPLAELALACGFSSQSHFTAAFTKAMGVSPGRFRKLHLS